MRPLLFRLDVERAHHLTLRLMRLTGALPPLAVLVRRFYAVPDARPVEVFGLLFPNRVGLAAGYDKDGTAWRGLAALGFGHIEIGTVTPRQQPGNPRPRVFRLVEDQAVINRMGFPGQGAAFVARQLHAPRPPGLVLGINLGINKDTSLEQAAEEYCGLQDVFQPLADYLVVNVSSPNTLGLRQLQGREHLTGLLSALNINKSKPLLVKLAPDLSDAELDDALDVMLAAGVDGIIATNTTISRPDLRSPNLKESGGLSGAPLAERSTALIAAIRRRAGDALPVIGVGGIDSPETAQKKLDAGASLVQIYTGMIYQGPGLVKRIMAAI